MELHVAASRMLGELVGNIAKTPLFDAGETQVATNAMTINNRLQMNNLLADFSAVMSSGSECWRSKAAADMEKVEAHIKENYNRILARLHMRWCHFITPALEPITQALAHGGSGGSSGQGDKPVDVQAVRTAIASALEQVKPSTAELGLDGCSCL